MLIHGQTRVMGPRGLPRDRIHRPSYMYPCAILISQRRGPLQEACHLVFVVCSLDVYLYAVARCPAILTGEVTHSYGFWSVWMIDVVNWGIPVAMLLSAGHHRDDVGETARTETWSIPYLENWLNAAFSTSAPFHDDEATYPDTYLFHCVALGAQGAIAPRVICAYAPEHLPLPCASMPHYVYRCLEECF